MHVELPKKGALASFKGFASEYAMIVVSILTALALEHGAQTWHHNHRAHEAQSNIESEMRTNLEEVRTSMRKNQEELVRLDAVRDVLRKDILNKVEGKVLVDHIRQASNGKFGLSQSMPTLRREAWEVAVASQAVSWMEPALLQRYAGVYAMQRDFSQSSINTVQLMLDAPSLSNKSADVEFGVIDGAGLYHSVVQMQGALRGTQSSLADVEKELLRAIPKS
jgi:hypothetical protein